MARKRPAGDGLIRKRKDGRWEGRIVIGHHDSGTPIYKTVYGKTQKDTLLNLHIAIEQYRNVNLTDDCRMTLEEWLNKWLDEYMSPKIRQTTMLHYRTAAEKYIVPILGHKPIYLITRFDVQKMYRKIKNEGRIKEHPEMGSELSDTSVNRIHAVFHNAMEHAVKARLIAYNPCEGAVVPKAKFRTKKVLDDEQLERFIQEVEKDPLWYDFFYTELTTGLRRGEICALMWRDFDVKKGTLSIRRTMVKSGDGHFEFNETKTNAGMRMIYLPESTYELLCARKKDALTQWIFYNPIRPEHPVYPDAAYRKLKEFLKNAGLPDIRFHDLRHTFATHAIAKGVDAKTLSGILGHTNASFTLDTYTHVTGDMQRQAANVVENLLDEIMGKDFFQWDGKESTGKEP